MENEFNMNLEDLVQKQLIPLAQWAIDCIINKNGDFGEITEIILPGGRASGKSSFTSLIKILDLIYNKRSSVTIMKNEVNLSGAAFSQINMDLDRMGLSDTVKAIKRPLEIRSKTSKAKMLFKGADKPEVLKSIAVEGGLGICHIEEADRIASHSDYMEMTAALRGSNYLMVLTYNPPRLLNHWITELEKPTPHRLVVKTNYIGMPEHWLGKSSIQRINELKTSMNKKWRDMYKRIYLGEYVKTGVEIFTNVHSVELDIHNISKDEVVVKGMDFGFMRDPTVYIFASYNKELRRLRVYKELRFIRTLADTLAMRVNEIEHSVPYQDILIKGDSASSNTIAEMRHSGVTNITECYKFKGSRDYGWRFLELLDRIEIDTRYANGTYEECLAATFQTDKEGNVYGSYPEKDDHGIDALRYALEDIIRQDAYVQVLD